MAIRCPHCGSPVMVRGNRWECGYCGDFGAISSLQPSEKAKHGTCGCAVCSAFYHSNGYFR